MTFQHHEQSIEENLASSPTEINPKLANAGAAFRLLLADYIRLLDSVAGLAEVPDDLVFDEILSRAEEAHCEGAEVSAG